jgi:hypothetical protein
MRWQRPIEQDPSVCQSCSFCRLCRCHINPTNQKLRKRRSLALASSTFSRIAGSGSIRAISIAPTIVEKMEKKARSLSVVRRPGMNGSIRLLYFFSSS